MVWDSVYVYICVYSICMCMPKVEGGAFNYSENRHDYGKSTCNLQSNIKYELVSHFSVDSDELMSISLCPGWEDNVIQFLSTLFDA